MTGGQDTIGLRLPRHPLARELLSRFGGGLAAPSANRFGGVSPTAAEHVRSDLGSDVELVLDGGRCEVGVESTIVDLSGDGPALLRPGSVTVEELERVLGAPVARGAKSEVRAPGMLASHYAPKAGLLLVEASEAARRVEALASAGSRVAVMSAQRLEVPPSVVQVSMPADAEGFARELYAAMRDLDGRGVEVIVAVAPDERGVGLAVLDRLRRAGAPRK